MLVQMHPLLSGMPHFLLTRVHSSGQSGSLGRPDSVRMFDVLLETWDERHHSPCLLLPSVQLFTDASEQDLTRSLSVLPMMVKERAIKGPLSRPLS